MKCEPSHSRLTPETAGALVRKCAGAVEEIARLTSIPIPAEALLERIIDQLTRLLQVKQGWAMLLDPLTDELTLRAARGLPFGPHFTCRVKCGEGIVGHVVMQKTVYLATPPTARDAGRDSSIGPRAACGLERTANEPDAALYIPLLVGTECQGVIALGSSSELDRFTPDGVAVVVGLAQCVGLTMENARLKSEISGTNLNLLKSLAMAIDAKDNYTRMHSMRVTRYAVMIGVRMGLSRGDIETLRRGALLHDIGKIGVRDHILAAPRRLTKAEVDALREHPVIGAKILGSDGPFQVIVPLVLHHHERYDGRGYPSGLKGVAIPLGARIIAVADAFEAMTADRPYRRALSPDDALAELQRNSGTQFDPDVVAAFVRLAEEGNDLAQDGPPSGP